MISFFLCFSSRLISRIPPTPIPRFSKVDVCGVDEICVGVLSLNFNSAGFMIGSRPRWWFCVLFFCLVFNASIDARLFAFNASIKLDIVEDWIVVFCSNSLPDTITLALTIPVVLDIFEFLFLKLTVAGGSVIFIAFEKSFFVVKINGNENKSFVVNLVLIVVTDSIIGFDVVEISVVSVGLFVVMLANVWMADSVEETCVLTPFCWKFKL